MAQPKAKQPSALKVHFSWERLWVDRGTEPPLDSQGFLYACEEGRNSSVSRSHELQTERCVIFLGEPSSGKSKTIGTQGIDRPRLERIARDAGDHAMWLDLREVTQAADLERYLTNQPEFEDWRIRESSKLYLFLDSLDECILSVPEISNILLKFVRSLPIERLMLRVACRTAEWPSYLELELEKLYRQDLCIVELAPLREEDARVAAEQAGIDVQTFFRQINDLNAVPFARKPSTLVFLLSIVAQGGTLPKTQWQLYEQGCRIRCDEYNKSRIASHKTANLTPDQLLEAASRIAALCIFTDQQKLHAESEAVIELWNYTSTKPRQYWPQDENDFSNWLKRRLEEEIVARGVVVAREVEIRRKRSSRGERTDLYVVCKHPTTNEKIVVVVEVKGCWNPDLKSAMKTQLADRYLKDNFYDHGVYLVGWFLCDKWRNQDRRKRKVPFKRLDQARRFFKKQAHSLASEQTFLKALVMDIALR